MGGALNEARSIRGSLRWKSVLLWKACCRTGARCRCAAHGIFGATANHSTPDDKSHEQRSTPAHRQGFSAGPACRQCSRPSPHRHRSGLVNFIGVPACWNPSHRGSYAGARSRDVRFRRAYLLHHRRIHPAIDIQAPASRCSSSSRRSMHRPGGRHDRRADHGDRRSAHIEEQPRHRDQRDQCAEPARTCVMTIPPHECWRASRSVAGSIFPCNHPAHLLALHE